MIMKQSYADKLDSVTLFDEVHDEYAVLDKAGRLQIPREMLEQLHLSGNKVSIEYRDGGIFIQRPREEA